MDSPSGAESSRISVSFALYISHFTNAVYMIINFTLFLIFRKDSIVSEKINYDLLKTAKEIQDGTKSCPELLGHYNQSKTKENIPSAIQKHLSGSC